MSVAGFSVGLGSIWRVPYIVWKYGGGVFFIPYFLAIAGIGIPFFYLEVAIGQMYHNGSVRLMESFHKKYKGLGIMQLLMAVPITLC